MIGGTPLSRLAHAPNDSTIPNPEPHASLYRDQYIPPSNPLYQRRQWTHEQYTRTRTGCQGANRKPGTSAPCKSVKAPHYPQPLCRPFRSRCATPPFFVRKSPALRRVHPSGPSVLLLATTGLWSFRLLIPLLAHRILARACRSRHHNFAITIESSSVIRSEQDQLSMISIFWLNRPPRGGHRVGLEASGCPVAFLFLVLRNRGPASHARRSQLCLTNDNSSALFPEYSPFLRLWAVASSLLPTQETKDATGASLDLATLLSCTGSISRKCCILSRQVRPAATAIKRDLDPASRALDEYAFGPCCLSMFRVRVRAGVWWQGRRAPRAALTLPAVMKALSVLL